MEYERLEVLVLCRIAADKLDSDHNRDKTVLFPGWDFARTPADERGVCKAIRRAAAAIFGEDDPDSGSNVTMADLARLVRYIADMIDE